MVKMKFSGIFRILLWRGGQFKQDRRCPGQRLGAGAVGTVAAVTAVAAGAAEVHTIHRSRRQADLSGACGVIE
jgi:hypothetical protein